MFKTLLNKIKAFFKNSETIFLARLESVAGIFWAVIEGMDWSAILSLDFTNALASRQAIFIGGILFVKGVLLELARRRNATDL